MESMEDRACHTHPKSRKPPNNSQFPSSSLKDSVLTPIPILPAELITEILSRVPVKSLLKFRDGNIISIDLADEKWGKVEQPSYAVEDFSLTVGVFESGLSVFCDNQVTQIDVWVMKVYGVKESWTKMFTIKYPADAFVDYDYLLLPPSFISNKGEILVCFGSGKVMAYNPKNDSFRYSEVTNLSFADWRLTEVYVESLVCPLSTEWRKYTTGKTQMTTIKRRIA